MTATSARRPPEPPPQLAKAAAGGIPAPPSRGSRRGGHVPDPTPARHAGAEQPEQKRSAALPGDILFDAGSDGIATTPSIVETKFANSGAPRSRVSCRTARQGRRAGRRRRGRRAS
jgi:hypothetical protein